MNKKSYDAVVIGAGVLGASVAASLAGAGYSTLVLDLGVSGSGASGGNLGQISISDRWEPWHLRLALQSLSYYETSLSVKYDIDYVRSGGSIILSTQAQVEQAKRISAKLAEQGVASRLLTGSDMAQAEPNLNTDSALALLYCPLEGKLNPLATTLAFLDEAKAAGAEFLPMTQVTGFSIHSGRITAVLTSKGSFSAQWIVNCAGPWAAQVGRLAGVCLPVCWHKGTAFVSQPVIPTIRGPICGGGFIMGEENGPQPQRSIGFATVQTTDGTILIAQSTELADVEDKSVNMPSLTLVARRFLSYFPQLGDLQIVRAWAAQTTYTLDGLPVFGFSQQVQNFFTAAGFKGAFTVAGAVGNRALHALEGKSDPDLALCGPDRLITSG